MQRYLLSAVVLACSIAPAMAGSTGGAMPFHFAGATDQLGPLLVQAVRAIAHQLGLL